jgi:hypothetical protein
MVMVLYSCLMYVITYVLKWLALQNYLQHYPCTSKFVLEQYIFPSVYFNYFCVRATLTVHDVLQGFISRL